MLSSFLQALWPNVKWCSIVSYVTIENKGNPPNKQKKDSFLKPLLSWQQRSIRRYLFQLVSILWTNISSASSTKNYFHLASFLSCWVPYFFLLEPTEETSRFNFLLANKWILFSNGSVPFVKPSWTQTPAHSQEYTRRSSIKLRCENAAQCWRKPRGTVPTWIMSWGVVNGSTERE